MSNWFHARTIVEDASVQTAADDYSQEFSRFYDLWECLKWLLAREGESLEGLRTTENGKEFHLYKTAANTGKDVPSITVIYTVTDNEIRLHGLKVENEEAKQKATVTELQRSR